MTYYEFLWRWKGNPFGWVDDKYIFECCYLCATSKCPFGIGGGCVLSEVTLKGIHYTNFNQLVKLAQGLRKAGLLK